MYLSIQVMRDKKGLPVSPVSLYQPEEKEKKVNEMIRQDFETAYQVHTKPYRELNDLSLIQRQSKDQQSFNSYVPPKSNDPDNSWHSNAIRPIVRNRLMSIVAHLTANLVYPQVFAQNKNDENDKESASVMRDLMEWAGEQADYVKTFFYAVIAACVNPASIIHTEYVKKYRTVKEIDEKGKWTEKEIENELFSGFKDSIVPVDEIFFSNIYEQDLQKQPFIIWTRILDYSLAQQKYDNNEKFKKYVKPGVVNVFDTQAGQFYEVRDENLTDRQVREVIYYNRALDLQLINVNGVLLTDPEQPNPRQDKKYPFVKFGYELVDEGRFAYYYSLVRKMSKDEEIVNTLYRMIIDGTYLQLMPPTVVFGNETINASVVAPGTVTTLSENSKIQKLDIGGNLSAGLSVIQKVEASISESSNDVLQSGQAEKGVQTAYEISRLEQNARLMLGNFSKMIGFMVKELGELRISDILQYLTVGEITDIASDAGRLKFKTLFVESRGSEKKRTKKLIFQPDLEVTDPLMASYDVLEEEGGLNSDLEIYKINPKLFRERKFKIKVSPDTVTPPSDILQKVLNLELYDRAIASPYINHEAITKALLLGSYDATKDSPEEFMAENPQLAAREGTPPGAAKETTLAKILGAQVNKMQPA